MEDCLNQYPDEAPELRPLLQTAIAVRGSLSSDLPVPARSRIRATVLAAWDERAARSQGRRWRWSLPKLLPRWAAVAVSLLLAAGIGGTGTLTASASAIPGDILYPVKELREEARLWFNRSPEERVAIYSDLVRERAAELVRQTSIGRTRASGVAVSRLEDHLAELDQLAELLGAPAPAREGLEEALADSAAVQQEALRALQQALPAATVDARPGIERALEAIQRARERVDSALDALRQ